MAGFGYKATRSCLRRSLAEHSVGKERLQAAKGLKLKDFSRASLHRGNARDSYLEE